MELQSTVFENIWLADDDKDDCEVFEDVVRQILPSITITVFRNGDELMAAFDSTKHPDILFLDINMPCRDGLDCLKEIRKRKEYDKLPIVIFSSSIQPKLIDDSYNYGASLYYTKPSTFQELIAGLSDLLQMNWNDPYIITKAHYVNNKFVPYNPSGINDSSASIATD